MGYLIGGAGEEAQAEIVAEGGKFAHLTNEQLRDAHSQCVKDVTKYSNFQMVRKICLNSLYGAIGNQYFRQLQGGQRRSHHPHRTSGNSLD